jgi:hypothetical protein
MGGCCGEYGQRAEIFKCSAVPGFTSHPLYHWNLKNMRLFLESFAKNRQMDPLSADTWYKLTSSAVRELKGGHAILKKFNGYFEAVEALFPEVELDLSTYKLYMWDDEANRRKFFENYASANDFDPLVPDNWYAQPRDKITSYKGAAEVLSFYNRSVSAALIALFPDIGIESSKFFWPTWVYSVAKTFFLRYAAEYGFDPLTAENWYSQPMSRITEHRVMLNYCSVTLLLSNSPPFLLLDYLFLICIQRVRLLFCRTMEVFERHSLLCFLISDLIIRVSHPLSFL